MSALISSPLFSVVDALHSEGTPARKPWDKFVNIGTRRESSSSRGNDLAVNYMYRQSG